MRVTSVALAAHLAANVTTLAVCWKVTRVDAEVFGFTSHDRDLVIDGLTYVSALGIGRGALESGTTLQAVNTEVVGFLGADVINVDDLRAGLWDHAEVRIFDVNWADLTMGELKQLRGWLGEFTLVGNAYTAELRGLTTAFSKSIGELVSPSCSATVGDARCTVDLTDYTTTGEVTAVTDAREFDTDLSGATVRLTPTSTGAPPAGYFDAGLITWSTGLNAGRRMEVKTSALDGAVELQLPMVDAIAPGDTFSMSAGCAKSREVCISKYGNILFFRGFPDLPGIDKVNRFGGQ